VTLKIIWYVLAGHYRWTREQQRQRRTLREPAFRVWSGSVRTCFKIDPIRYPMINNSESLL
jgi:hypothetical protein